MSCEKSEWVIQKNKGESTNNHSPDVFIGYAMSHAWSYGESSSDNWPIIDSNMSEVLLLYFIFLFDIKILNIAPYMLRRGMYACVRRWAIYVHPHGVWLSTGIDVRLRRASKVYMTVPVSIPRVYMRIDDVRFWYSVWWPMIAISWGRNGTIPMVTELSLLSNKL